MWTKSRFIRECFPTFQCEECVGTAEKFVYVKVEWAGISCMFFSTEIHQQRPKGLGVDTGQNKRSRQTVMAVKERLNGVLSMQSASELICVPINVQNGHTAAVNSCQPVIYLLFCHSLLL